MRQLSDFIEMSRYEGAGCLSLEYFMRVNGVNENTITNEMMDWYANMTWDMNSPVWRTPIMRPVQLRNPFFKINEMLNSIDATKLVKELSKNLGCGVKIDTHGGFSNKEEGAKQLLIPYDNFDLKEVEDRCEAMYWDFTSIYCEVYNKKKKRIEFVFISPKLCKEHKIHKYLDKYVVICVEPKNMPLVTKYIKNECKGILYHITIDDKDIIKKIKKIGLKPKGTKNKYRYIDGKVYLFTGKNNEEIYRNASIVFNSLIGPNKDIEFRGNYRLFKVDASKYNIDFYQDTFYDEKGIVFTYAYFPPSMIKDVDPSEVGL